MDSSLSCEVLSIGYSAVRGPDIRLRVQAATVGTGTSKALLRAGGIDADLSG